MDNLQKGEKGERIAKRFLEEMRSPFIWWPEQDAVAKLPKGVQAAFLADFEAVTSERRKVYTPDFHGRPWGFGFDALAAINGVWGWLEVKSGKKGESVSLTRGQRIHRGIAEKLGIPVYLAKVNLEDETVELRRL